MGIIEQLLHSTVRIECKLANGDVEHGTGFFFNFPVGDIFIPVVVSNKHVVEGAITGSLIISTRDKDGVPDIINHKQISVSNFENAWIPHPDNDVDLAVFPIGPLVNNDDANGKTLFYIPLSVNLIPTKAQKDELSAMEDVIMVGYPNGLWDSKHNLPVIRKGITATHCAKPFEGKLEFLTDIASFLGSSGSPVFLANIGGYIDASGATVIGPNRIYLLGIHYGSAMQTTTGELQVVKSPTSTKTLSVTKIPMSIGVVIDSARILEFGSILKKMADLK